MKGFSWRVTGIFGVAGWMLLLSPGFSSQAQTQAPRSHNTTAAPALPTFAPQAAPPPINLLEQPAHEAQVTFAGDHLSIQADNASLASILRQVASASGMKITGLASDERVFGNFGPGSPRDVLADLLNGTAYNVVLLGDASLGAPRELILTPLARGGATASPAPSAQATPDEVVNDQESQDGPQPDVPSPPSATQPGVRTPQQLFQQLQKMREAQQQQFPQSDQPAQPQAQQPPPQ